MSIKDGFIRIWITKRALTEGIVEKLAEIVKEPNGDEYFRVKDSSLFEFYRRGINAFSNRQSAVMHAESLRARKIESLKRQIERLEKLSFEKE